MRVPSSFVNGSGSFWIGESSPGSFRAGTGQSALPFSTGPAGRAPPELPGGAPPPGTPPISLPPVLVPPPATGIEPPLADEEPPFSLPPLAGAAPELPLEPAGAPAAVLPPKVGAAWLPPVAAPPVAPAEPPLPVTLDALPPLGAAGSAPWSPVRVEVCTWKDTKSFAPLCVLSRFCARARPR